MDNNINNIDGDDRIDILNEFYRYLSFWPWFLLSITIFFTSAFIYLRYVEYKYESVLKIEVMDKAQDSEMALPTAMTIFNRSMINLENEIGVLSSFSIHKQVVENLISNVKFYTVGNIKTSENHHSEWISDYDISYKIDTDTVSVSNSYELKIVDKKLLINHFDSENELVKEYSFNNMSTTSNASNELPFDITIRRSNGVSDEETYLIKILPFENVISSFSSLVEIDQSGKQSDQLIISLEHPNIKIGNEYLNTLALVFDRDGVVDRQLVYKRTMDFVDSRFDFLTKDLNLIESRKQQFKEINNLTDIKTDASINVEQQFAYDAELFKAMSQDDLASLLKEALNDSEYKLMPVNIGIENSNINTLISEYNLIVKERDGYLLSAGPNNSIVKKIEKQIRDFSRNISISIDNYKKSLQITIASLEKKEKEFENIYKDIPENEKILRSIERELEIKESLFLLLLQKREEAAINYAVVKPSIKIIDDARSSAIPVSPIRNNLYIGSILLGIFIPFLIIFIYFLTDNKIHTREQLAKYLKNIPVIGEIPYVIDKKTLYNIVDPTSRATIAESIRIIIANLNFILFDKSSKKGRSNVILVTSSVKGEGKTIVSVNTASVLSSKFKKVLLLGADLRNPQIHKFLSVDKNVKDGLSDYIYKDEKDWREYVIKYNNFDIILSGTIPPNPNQLLSSEKFKEFIDTVKNHYDCIVIDSAPCLMVSDTLEISKYVDSTIYVIRANFSKTFLTNFLVECSDNKKLPNISVVLNSVGNSASYGYRYGYQYGYKYGYKYGYNYGYGYGYNEDITDE